MRIRTTTAVLFLLAIIACPDLLPAEAEKISVDVCVLGGSEAGCTAAIQAARMGKRTVLIEPTRHPGGMLVEGIGKDIRFGSACVISFILQVSPRRPFGKATNGMAN